MNFYRKKYCIKDWRGIKHFLTDEELYNRIKEDCKSDYSWIASATELVKACSSAGFSEEYAKYIKIAILNCFARLEFRREKRSYRKSTDNNAVYFCYNSLKGTDIEVIETKQTYLSAIIKGITLYHFEFPIHTGPTYFKICEEWREKKYNESIVKEKINFKKLIKELHKDFERTIRDAENEGKLEKEDVRYKIICD